MQSPSPGQQFISPGSAKVIFPEHAHLVILTPPPQKIKIISAVRVVTMFAKRFIFGCKNSKKN